MRSGVEHTRRANLERLLRPRHIAFIGGGALEGAIRACDSIGFGGALWPVSTTRASIGGRACVSSVKELPEAPDAAFVAVPVKATVGVVAELAALGAGAAVCYGAGGAEGERALRAAAGGMALVGPNSLGLLNYLDRVALWREVHGGEPVRRGVAVISQSGNFALTLTFNARSLPLACVVSAGNEAGLGVGDLIAALAADPRVDALGLFLEGIKHVERFAEACAQALAAGKPVVALKTGVSEASARVVRSHTHSLAGTDAFYEALFERLGILRVRSAGELVEALKYLSLSPKPDARRLGILTCSGGDAAVAADCAERAGLAVPALARGQRDALARQMPHAEAVGNPLDYFVGGWGDEDALARCFRTFMSSELDAVVLVLDHPRCEPQAQGPWTASLEALIRATKETGRTAVVASVLPELLPDGVRRRAIAGGVVPLQGLEDAMSALGAGARYAAMRGERAAAAGQGRLGLASLAPLPGKPRRLDEWESKLALERYGLRRPQGGAGPAGEAPGAAQAVGFPVVVKALSLGVVHKSEAGAVQVGLTSPDQVARAVAKMRRLSERFLVEAMVTDVVAELIVGVRREAPLGFGLVMGSGGRLAELAADVRVLLLPAERAEIERALQALRCARLLEGYRGGPPGDRERLVDALAAVAACAWDMRERLLSLEINPLLVLPRGRDCVVADASLTLAAPPP